MPSPARKAEFPANTTLRSLRCDAFFPRGAEPGSVIASGRRRGENPLATIAVRLQREGALLERKRTVAPCDPE